MTTTVYVLMLEYDCEPSFVRGVYSNLGAARAAVESFSAENRTGHLSVYPVLVDAAPLPIGDLNKEIAL